MNRDNVFPERLEPEEEWRGDANTEGKREEEEGRAEGATKRELGL